MSAVDFDAMLAEVEAPANVGATFEFKFLGKAWQVPVSPPAKEMLQIRKLNMLAAELQIKQETGKISDDDAEKIIEATGVADFQAMLNRMVGAELVDQWLDLGINDEQLRQLVRYFWLRYNGKAPASLAGDGTGEAAAPAEGPTPSPLTSEKSQ